MKPSAYHSWWLMMLCLGWPLAAAAGGTLSWTECASEAAARHPDLAAQREALRAARAAESAARGPLLPQLSANAGARWSRQDDLPADRSLNVGLSAQQLLWDGGQTWRALSLSGLGRENAELGYATASADVRQRLRLAFVELQRSQAAEGLAREIRDRRQQNLELVRLRYEAGREHHGSLLQAQAQLAQARAGVSQASRDLLLARVELNRELGRPLMDPVAVEPVWAAPAAGETPDFAAAVRAHPQWRALAVGSESAREKALAAQGTWFPNLSASASAGRAGGEWPPDSRSLSAGLSLTWTLFNGGQRLGAIDQAQAAWARARAEETAGQQTLAANAVNAWAAFQDSAEAVAVQKQFLAAAEERARISEAQYSTGLLGFDNWTIIEDELVSVQKAYLTAQAQALRDEAGWVRAQGGTLENAR